MMTIRATRLITAGRGLLLAVALLNLPLHAAEPPLAGADMELSGELLRQERLGYYYWGRGDMFGGMQYLRPVAEAGHPLSQYRMGLMEYGGGDFRTAADWHRRALKGGVPQAGLELARMYRNGEIGDKDPQAAFALELTAAEAGLADGMVRVASAYQSGSGVEASPEQARQWYRRAADQGSVVALRWLLEQQRTAASQAAGSKAVTPAGEQAISKLQAALEEAATAANQQRIELRNNAFEEFRAIEREYFNRGQ